MPNIKQNLIGKHFGHLTVIAKSDKRGTQNEYKWICRCDCGKLTEVSTGMLNSGEITSCGHVRLEKSKHNLRFTQDRHMKQLNDRPPVTNKSGYRNISITYRNGKKKYRVAVVYDHKQHSTLAATLEEALKKREELRDKWWPNYQSKLIDEILNEKSKRG